MIGTEDLNEQRQVYRTVFVPNLNLMKLRIWVTLLNTYIVDEFEPLQKYKPLNTEAFNGEIEGFKVFIIK